MITNHPVNKKPSTQIDEFCLPGFRKSGGDRSRTGVQTYSPKAFYMFISLLVVGNEQETNKPIHYLAG